MAIRYTLNGIDGFLSGKWETSNPENVSYVDDETTDITVVVAGSYRETKLTVTLKPNTTYTFSYEGEVERLGVSGNVVSGGWKNTKTHTFTTNATGGNVSLHLGYNVLGTFRFKRPQLVLGTQAIPYEKKRGDRMVKPQYYNGAYHLNPQPTRVQSALRSLSAVRSLEAKR